jgi:hypothetical protein
VNNQGTGKAAEAALSLKKVIDGGKGESAVAELKPGSALQHASQAQKQQTLPEDKNLAEILKDRVAQKLGVRFANTVKLAHTPPGINSVLVRINPKSNDILTLVDTIEGSTSMPIGMGGDEDEGDDDMGEAPPPRMGPPQHRGGRPDQQHPRHQQQYPGHRRGYGPEGEPGVPAASIATSTAVAMPYVPDADDLEEGLPEGVQGALELTDEPAERITPAALAYEVEADIEPLEEEDEEEVAEPTRARRRAPAKRIELDEDVEPVDVLEEDDEEAPPAEEAADEKPKRRRGRPPKRTNKTTRPAASSASEADDEPADDGDDTPKRGGGTRRQPAAPQE